MIPAALLLSAVVASHSSATITQMSKLQQSLICTSNPFRLS